MPMETGLGEQSSSDGCNTDKVSQLGVELAALRLQASGGAARGRRARCWRLKVEEGEGAVGAAMAADNKERHGGWLLIAQHLGF
jgi:hypothetical protein